VYVLKTLSIVTSKAVMMAGFNFKLLIEIDKCQTKYATTLATLADIALIAPEIQRDVDETRVKDIVEYQTKMHAESGSLLFIGDITLAHLDDCYYVIDGLHRLTAMRECCKLQPDYNVTVTIVQCSSTADMIHAFKLMNKAEPVPPYIIQTTVDITRRKKLDEFRTTFIKTFKCYISSARNPHRPNVNIDTLLGVLASTRLPDQFKTGSEIMKYFMYVNDKHIIWLDNKNKIVCDTKATKYNCKALYATSDVDNSWIDNAQWLDGFHSAHGDGDGVKAVAAPQQPCFDTTHVNNTVAEIVAEKQQQQPQPQQPHLPQEDNQLLNKLKDLVKRKTIPKAIRTQVWKRLHNTLDGKCFTCTNIISIDNFECGHIISRKNGGSDEPVNLLPICGKCNKSMSSTNMDDYCMQYGIEAAWSGLG